jgi:hypothetical protein
LGDGWRLEVNWRTASAAPKPSILFQNASGRGSRNTPQYLQQRI